MSRTSSRRQSRIYNTTQSFSLNLLPSPRLYPARFGSRGESLAPRERRGIELGEVELGSLRGFGVVGKRGSSAVGILIPRVEFVRVRAASASRAAVEELLRAVGPVHRDLQVIRSLHQGLDAVREVRDLLQEEEVEGEDEPPIRVAHAQHPVIGEFLRGVLERVRGAPEGRDGPERH